VKHAIKMKYGVKIKLSRILIRVTIVVVTVIIFYYSNELMVIREQYSKKKLNVNYRCVERVVKIQITIEQSTHRSRVK